MLKQLFGKKNKKASEASLSTSLRKREKPELPFDGYEAPRYATRYVDILSDEALKELNAMLDWHCFTVDSHGRRFGDAAWKGKRDAPMTIPGYQIEMMKEHFDLSTKHVLEVGCFEGIHTIGLLQLARQVTAVDARMENVVRTIVRCAMFGLQPTVFQCDVESPELDTRLLQADILHHVGVLYHLKDPVRHLAGLQHYIAEGLMLDTHYATPEMATETYESGGQTYRYKKYGEFGYQDPFSGMYDHSKWLLMDDLLAILQQNGFPNTQVIWDQQLRNGPRAIIIAKKA